MGRHIFFKSVWKGSDLELVLVFPKKKKKKKQMLLKRLA